MRMFFVIALLSAIAGSYFYKQVDRVRCQKLHEELRMLESEIKQCRTADHIIRQRRRQLAILQAENKRLQARLQSKGR